MNKTTTIIIASTATVIFLYLLYVLLNIPFGKKEQPMINVPIPTPIPTRSAIPSLSPSVPPMDEQLRLQTEADKKFSDWQKEIYKNYPWYDSLPLQEEKYFIYFDLDQKKFIAYLYPSKSSPESVDRQTNSLQREIMQRLASLGIETSKYLFQWSILPQ